MTIKECYDSFGGSYEGVMGLLGSEKFVDKYMRKFPLDQNYELLKAAVNAHDFDHVFMPAHSMKGVSANLSFTKLFESTSVLCDMVREGFVRASDDAIVAQFDIVSECYNAICSAIAAYSEANPQ